MEQPLVAPATMQFEALPHLGYSKFRLRRKTFQSDRSVAGMPLTAGQTSTIACSAPSNWYLLGNRSKICWESVLSGGSDSTAPLGGEYYRRMKYGPHAAWQRVQETVNSGALTVGRVDEATQSLGRTRAFLSRRSVQHFFAQIGSRSSGIADPVVNVAGTFPGWNIGDPVRFDSATGPPSANPAYGTVTAVSAPNGFPTAYLVTSPGVGYAVGENLIVTRTTAAGGQTGNTADVGALVTVNEVLDRSIEPDELIINSLEASGCVNRGLRSRCSAAPAPTQSFSGFPYAVPLTAYSRLAQNDYVPVGLMGQFNPASAWQFEFTVAEVGDAAAAPFGAGSAPATGHDVYNLRLEAYFLELLDSRIQDAITAQFNRETVQTPNGPVTLKLELPILALEHQVYQLANGSTSAVISIQSNSPSLRGICVIPRTQVASDDGAVDYSGIRWNSIQALAGGYSIMERAAREENNNRPMSLDSWLTTQREDAAYLFSLYAPQREAIVGDSASQLIGLQGQLDVTIGNICLNFENADGDEIAHLKAARGLDMRNIGRLDLHLDYEQNLPGQSDVGIAAAVQLDVLLVYDVLYQVGRDGVRDVSTYEFGP